jgi:hypothetical protein
MPDLRRRKTGLLIAVVAASLLAVAWFVVGQLWPVYDLALDAPSPDGRYVVAVIRGDKAAFDDFFYRVYVFPRTTAPQSKRGERVWMQGPWADQNYLIYDGYSIPALRWTSSREIEIDLDELHYDVRAFNPAPSLPESGRDRSLAVLASLLLNKTDKRNLSP